MTNPDPVKFNLMKYGLPGLLLALILFVVVPIGLSVLSQTFGASVVMFIIASCVLVVGQVLAHYTKLKFLGWVSTLMSVGLAGFGFLSLIPVLRMEVFSDWSWLAWAALLATLVMLTVVGYGGWRVIEEGRGRISKGIFYLAVTIVFAGGISYYWLGEAIFSALVKFLRNRSQEKVARLINSPEIPWDWPEVNLNYVVFGLGVIIIAIILWPRKTTVNVKEEKKGGH